jgi:uncharacterized SAM-binding protein YcdF (DUF218 family)
LFFVLSKLLAFLIKPLNVVILTGLAGFLTKNPRKRQRLALWSLLLLIVFTNRGLVSWCAGRWETGQVNPDGIAVPYDIGILLGGYYDFDTRTPPGVVSFSISGNRFDNTLLLYKQGKIKKILLSGGAGRLVGTVEAETPVVRRYLNRIGVPDSVLILEDRSRNTRENALYSKMLIDSLYPGGTRCLLISSAWHLRRAGACFQKAGLPCDLFGADYFTEQSNDNPFRWIEPDWETLMKWNALIKEWIGYAAYWAKGYV